MHFNSFAGEANYFIVRFRVASNYANVTRKMAFPLNNYCVVGYTNVCCVAKHMYTVVISTCRCGTIMRCCPRKS